MAEILLVAGSFVAMWTGSTLLLSYCPWFQPRPSLIDRLGPHQPQAQNWVNDIETWLQRQ